MRKKVLRAVALALAVWMFLVSTVLAISNPDTISFYCVGSVPIYKVFYNVLEPDDLLFTAEQFVHYAASPNETASEAFLFEVLNVAGNETIASIPLNEYEAKPISIYFNAAQVVADNLTIGTAYIIRIIGNPLLFPTSENNTVSATLNADDYVDQLLGVDDGVPTNNPLRNYMIGVADDLETYDSPIDDYIVIVSGFRYLTAVGGSIFLQDIPALGTMCPILFANIVYPMEGDPPETTGAYASTLSPLAKWGDTAANGLTNLGIYLGINQALAGSVVLLMLVMGFAVYVYIKTQSGIAVLLLMGATPFLGAWFGLMPIALAFIITIIIVVLMGFFFFSRGTL